MVLKAMEFYLVLKALHIISMVAWFAGLFYIFRLYVYHVKHRENSDICRIYEQMERKLLYIIMHPAMLLTFLFGLLLISQNPLVLSAPWFHFKLLLVAVLVAYQIFAGITQKRFARDEFFLSEKACRFINEIPTLVLIGVVLLAVLKPGL